MTPGNTAEERRSPQHHGWSLKSVSYFVFQIVSNTSSSIMMTWISTNMLLDYCHCLTSLKPLCFENCFLHQTYFRSTPEEENRFRNIVFWWSKTMEIVQQHISDDSHTTPLLKNFSVLSWWWFTDISTFMFWQSILIFSVYSHTCSFSMCAHSPPYSEFYTVIHHIVHAQWNILSPKSETDNSR
jgi:hypothetical protein